MFIGEQTDRWKLFVEKVWMFWMLFNSIQQNVHAQYLILLPYKKGKMHHSCIKIPNVVIGINLQPHTQWRPCNLLCCCFVLVRNPKITPYMQMEHKHPGGGNCWISSGRVEETGQQCHLVVKRQLLTDSHKWSLQSSHPSTLHPSPIQFILAAQRL